MVQLPASARRVPEHTAEHVNLTIRQQTLGNIAYYANRTGEIGRRLEELEREWDIERVLETNASSLALFGLSLGFFVDKRWFILPTIVGTFLLQHGLQGWCPPIPILRRLGFRTRHEIDLERYALKIVRGDFKEISGDAPDKEKLLQAVER
jgi:hypothetical protein